MKFGLEVVLEGRKVLQGVSTQYPHPQVQGGSKGSGVPLEPQGCILAKTLVARPHVLLEPWSLTLNDSS